MELTAVRQKDNLWAYPADWIETSVGEYGPFVTSGSRGWAAYYSKHGDLFVRITNMDRQSIDLDLDDSRFVSLPPSETEGVRTQLREGDVIISITADIGIISFIGNNVPSPAYINQHISLVRFPPELICSKFVAYFLAYWPTQRWFRSITDQGAKAGINLEAVRNIELVVPPTTKEQRAIATALSDVDALLDGLDRLIAKKRDIKQAAMQQLLTGKTRLPGFEGQWKIKRLGDGCSLITKGTTPTSIGKQFVQSGVVFVKVEALTENGEIVREQLAHIDPETHQVLKRSQLQKNDLLISIAGALGRVGIVPEHILPANTNQALAIVRLLKDADFDERFLFYAIKTERIQKHFDAISVQGAQANLSLQQISDIPIYCPAPNEQKAIAAILGDMDAEISKLEKRRTKTRDIKQAMMQELLTGRTRLV